MVNSDLMEIRFSRDGHLRQINGLHNGNTIEMIEMIEILRSADMMNVFGTLTNYSAYSATILKAVI
jgi:hypothetical protein